MTTILKSISYSLLAGCLWALTLTLASCHSETFDSNNPDVDLFVEQLRAGKYQPDEDGALGKVPHFTREDIGRLLKYADDLTLIPSFPLAAVSYSPGGGLRLGECVLWTVVPLRRRSARCRRPIPPLVGEPQVSAHHVDGRPLL